MIRDRLSGPLAWLAVTACLLLPTLPPDAQAAASSLRFFGNAPDGVGHVRIRVDASAPADIGSTDFTIEFWMRAPARENTAPAVECGENTNWLLGNIVIDRDRFNQDRKFGV